MWRQWRTIVAILLPLAVGVGVMAWWAVRPPPPPVIPLDGLEPDVALVIEEARKDVAANPQSGQAWGNLGRVLVANETNPAIAADCFGEAQRLDPAEPRWPYFAGGSLLDVGQRDAAIARLEQAVALCDRTPDAPLAPRLLLAETLAIDGQADAAASQFQQALNADPDNPRAHFGLAALAAARNQWPECRAHLERCSASPQARKKAAVQLAAVCERLEDRANADHFAALAARLPRDAEWTDPYDAENAPLARRKRDYYRTVDQMEAEGRFDKAVDILSRLAARHPGDYMPHMMLGRILPQKGDWHAARQEWGQAIAAFDRAEEHLQQARQMAPDTFQIQYLMGLVLLRRGEALLNAPSGDRQEATALLEESVRTSRAVLKQRADFGYAHMALGLALKQLGRRAEALVEFREAVHCNPEHADMHLFLGEALAEDGKLDDARVCFEQALLIARPNDRRPRAALDRYFPKEATKSKDLP